MFDLLPSKRRSEVPSVFSEMDDMLQKMWFDFPFHNLEEDANLSWSPRLDVSETDKALEVVADLPGMEKKDIKVSLDGDLLTIKGEKKEVKEKKDKHYHTIERRSGSFYRALRLPMDVENDKIDANFKDGVLTLTLPKSKEAAKKVAQIEIK
ncbi:MAG: Hsp20/alpha crystallin family protein [Deltaproteobacteria bacterium]|nr:Hsp20/alpha crystallin family protein [Deltaproteobacteria bacterium]